MLENYYSFRVVIGYLLLLMELWWIMQKKELKIMLVDLRGLYHALMNNEFDKDFITFLEDIEEKDCIFPEIDYMIYC